jgi:hypothetical protein
MLGGGIAYSVWRLATGWITKRTEFETWKCKKFSLLPFVQIDSGALPASYPMDTGVMGQGREAYHSLPTNTEVKKI